MSKEENKGIYTHDRKPAVEGHCGDTPVRFINSDTEETLDTMIENVRQYIRDNNGFGESDEVKDKLYKEAQEMVHAYSRMLGITKFALNVEPSSIPFIVDYLNNKVEYNVDNVFIGVEVKRYLETLLEDTNVDMSSIVEIPLDPTSMTYMYHMLSSWTGIGWSDDNERFINIITAFGQISTLIKYYDAQVQMLKDEVVDWIVSFEPNVTVDKN